MATVTLASNVSSDKSSQTCFLRMELSTTCVYCLQVVSACDKFSDMEWAFSPESPITKALSDV